MTTALETIAEQLQELEALRAQAAALARWESELEGREASVAQAAEQPWGSLAVARAEQLGIMRGREQAVMLIDQQLAWLRPGPTTTVLNALKSQIANL